MLGWQTGTEKLGVGGLGPQSLDGDYRGDRYNEIQVYSNAGTGTDLNFVSSYNFGLDGYFSEVILLPDQSYLSVYIKNTASQDSDDIDGYEYKVLGLLDSGQNTTPDHSNWFVVVDSNSESFQPVNGIPRKFDVSGCSRARVWVATTIGTGTISFNGYVKGGS